MGRLRIGGDGDAITADLQRPVVQTEDTGLAVVRDLVISKLGGGREKELDFARSAANLSTVKLSGSEQPFPV